MIKDAGDNLSIIEKELCTTQIGTGCGKTQLYGNAHPQLNQRIYDRKNGRAKERESRIVKVMSDSSSQAMVEAVSMERSRQVQVSSESDEDEEAVLRGAAEFVVNDEDDQIVRHCAALLIRKHDMSLVDKVLADDTSDDDDDTGDDKASVATCDTPLEAIAHKFSVVDHITSVEEAVLKTLKGKPAGELTRDEQHAMFRLQRRGRLGRAADRTGRVEQLRGSVNPGPEEIVDNEDGFINDMCAERYRKTFEAEKRKREKEDAKNASWF